MMTPTRNRSPQQMTLFIAMLVVVALSVSHAFTTRLPVPSRPSRCHTGVSHRHTTGTGSLHMMATTDAPLPAATAKKAGTNKVEGIKERSNYLRDPLTAELKTEEIFVNHDAMVVLKYHGSYMQDDRDKRTRGAEKAYQFMLRLKSPSGETPAHLYRLLDELADKHGQGDLRATTRQAWQIHGIMKGDLKTVISSIMKAGSSSVGACGDVSRNVMCSPAPFSAPAYKYARQYAAILADLFKPQTPAFTELWLGDEKVAEMEYWHRDHIQASGINVQEAMLKDTGRGIIIKDAVEPIYGQQYLPRKFKMAVTVPGDNSVDIYTNDVGLVVIVNESTGELEGFNVMVGGGMGRTHNKESTFARAADHLGFVHKDDVLELCKSILAAQRDHGNREIRLNSRMKYLVHERGIDGFRTLVEGYFGKSIAPWREVPHSTWRYEDWMGWHAQGDGKWFLGVNIEQGRVRDIGSVKVKSALKQVVDELGLDMILTPSQSIIFRDVKEADKSRLDAILKAHGILEIDQVDPLVRLSMACPALPLCGLAVTEAERRMPDWNKLLRGVLDKLGMSGEQLVTRMTGCPNGCARPYMAELALVGDGPEMYQVWVGGSPTLTNVAVPLANKVKWTSMEGVLTAMMGLWKDSRSHPGESFGAFSQRVGIDALNAAIKTATAGSE